MKKGLTTICHRFFSNLSNQTRLATLQHLMSKPMSVNELTSVLGQEQSMISHNLKPLLDCNFINLKKQGKKRIYSVNHETINGLFQIVENHAKNYCPKHEKCLKGENYVGAQKNC